MSDFLKDLVESTKKEFGVGDEINRQVMFEARERKKARGEKSPGREAPKMRQMFESYRTPQAVKAAMGFDPDEDFAAARRAEGIDFDVSTAGKRTGTVLGALASDVVQDKGRQFWWLINAAQAVGDIITEEALYRARPELYDEEPFTDPKTGRTGRRRKYAPGMVSAIAAPAGFAINTGLGLMTPFGGAEGYKAALPSEDDPSKTSNVLLEVASKYVLGKTGDLLPYSEFVKVRPDVSKDEYQRYKAFKFDKREDYNPFDDGKVSALMGALRYTDEGIHGPEVQFLGRSLPVTTGLIPFAGAVAGGALGVSKLGRETGDAKQTPNKFARQFGSDKPVRRGFMGSVGGLFAGNVIGNLVEAERRRRNAAENELDTMGQVEVN